MSGKEESPAISDVNFLDIFKLDLIFDAYSFAWIRWGKNADNDKGDIKERIKAEQTNIALLCALLLTIWFSVLFTGNDNSHRETSVDDLINILFWLAITLHFFAMINSTLFVMQVCSLETNELVRNLLAKIGNAELYPMIQFYFGGIAGTAGTLLMTYADFSYNVFVASMVGVIGIGLFINAVYYQYNVLSLKLVLQEDEDKRRKLKGGRFDLDIDLKKAEQDCQNKVILNKVSSTQPITGETLCYAPKLVKPVNREETASSGVTEEVLVIAFKDFKAMKPIQMSFSKGDIITETDSKGSWHRGILKTSTEHAITGNVLYYPPNFVKKYIPNLAGSDSEQSGALVVARRDFTAQKAAQMSFAKGDVIRVVDTTGAWHKGVLHQSSTQPITGKTLYYAPKLVKPVDTDETASSGAAAPAAAEVKKQEEILVVALADYKATKPVQMSFSKGDIITESDSTGSWHKGVLKTSTTYEITGKLLYYPPNFVKKI